MHILFLDESGTPPDPGSRSRHKYFVIAGIIVPEGQWHKLASGLGGLKIRKRIRGELKWRYFAPGNDDPKNPLRSMEQQDKDSIRSEMYRMICSDKSIKTLACVACIESAYEYSSIGDRGALYQATYKPVSERFQYYLQDLSKQVGRQEYGIIVSDHRGLNDDKRFRMHHQKLVNTTAEFTSNYRNLVESLFLQPSNFSVGIQFADMVAGAIWRKYESGDDRWYKCVEPSIRCSPSGVVDGYGVVKFPRGNWR